jgi:hypothetical protein
MDENDKVSRQKTQTSNYHSIFLFDLNKIKMSIFKKNYQSLTPGMNSDNTAAITISASTSMNPTMDPSNHESIQP